MKLLKVKQKMLAELMVNNPNMTNEELIRFTVIAETDIFGKTKKNFKIIYMNCVRKNSEAWKD